MNIFGQARDLPVASLVHALECKAKMEDNTQQGADLWLPSHELEVSVIAAEFNSRYYRYRYTDVEESNLDPLMHFTEHGWREGRDPCPYFSTKHYLAQNPDVAAAGCNPFWHYILFGRAEGRAAMPNQVAIDKHVLSTVAAEFDVAHYLSLNPDVELSGLDPLHHFLRYGASEGRDPNREFSTRFYRSQRPDVVNAGINVFYHYISSGRAEGRSARTDHSWRIDTIRALRPLETEAQDWRRPPPDAGDLLEAGAIRAQVRAQERRLVLSVAHDDYRTVAGGVQLCVQLEEQAFVAGGLDYLVLHPWQPSPLLADPDDPDPVVVLILNGASLGAARMSTVAEALAGADAMLSVHAMLGHAPEALAAVATRLQVRDAVFWVHDYFGVCPSYTLMRNRILFCGGPEPTSDACGICVFGESRRTHLRRLASLFAAVPFRVLAPSQDAADVWRRTTRLPAAELVVQPHCTLAAPVPPAEAPARQGPVRVAYIGFPVALKGWHAVDRLARRLRRDPRYQFHYFGLGAIEEAFFVRKRVHVVAAEPEAMTAALADAGVDVAVIWSQWPETFCFTAHEAAAAGAALVAFAGAGAAATLARAEGGLVLDDDAALDRAFDEGVVERLGRAARARRGPPRARTFSRMAASVLASEAAAP